MANRMCATFWSHHKSFPTFKVIKNGDAHTMFRPTHIQKLTFVDGLVSIQYPSNFPVFSWLSLAKSATWNNRTIKQKEWYSRVHKKVSFFIEYNAIFVPEVWPVLWLSSKGLFFRNWIQTVRKLAISNWSRFGRLSRWALFPSPHAIDKEQLRMKPKRVKCLRLRRYQQVPVLYVFAVDDLQFNLTEEAF